MSNATGKLSFVEKLGYGLGDAASNFFFQVFNLFLLYYYTDIYGIPAAAVGTMFLVTKIFDAVSDPVMGLIADRTNTRWGKFRPYLLWMAVPYGALGYLMFAGPDLSDTGKLIYAYVTYSLMMLVYTAINVPYSALLGVISPSSEERTKAAGFRFFCAFAAGWAIATFVPALKDVLGGDNEALGFRLTMGIFAVVSVLMFWFCFATTKERVVPKAEKSDVRADFSVMRQNGPWIALFITAIFSLMNVAVRNGSMIYYLKYYVGVDDAPLFLIFNETSVFMSLGMVGLLVGVVVTLVFSLGERFEKRSLMIFLTIANAVSMAVFYFIPPDQYWLMVAIHVIGSAFAGPTVVTVWSMYADCADYGEWKTGRRTTALVFSSVLFAQKLGLAVGAGMAGWILGWFGFVPNIEQTDTAMTGIRFLFSVVPAILAILGTIAITFYRIDNAMLQRIEADLAERPAT